MTATQNTIIPAGRNLTQGHQKGSDATILCIEELAVFDQDLRAGGSDDGKVSRVPWRFDNERQESCFQIRSQTNVAGTDLEEMV